MKTNKFTNTYIYTYICAHPNPSLGALFQYIHPTAKFRVSSFKDVYIYIETLLFSYSYVSVYIFRFCVSGYIRCMGWLRLEDSFKL